MNDYFFTPPNDSFETRKQSFLKELDEQTNEVGLHGYLIKKGQVLSFFPNIRDEEDALIAGCLNNIWLKHELIEERLFFQADSDSKIIKGAIAILGELLSGLSCGQVLVADLEFLYEGPFRNLFKSTRFNSIRTIQQRLEEQCLLFLKMSESIHSSSFSGY